MNLKDGAASPYLLAFRSGVTVTEKDGSPVLQLGNSALSLRATSSGVLAAFKALSSGGATEQELVDRAAQEGVTGQATVLYHLDRFKRVGVLSYTATSDGRKLATLIPTSTTRPVIPGQVVPDTRYALSRFACIRRDGTHLLVESPIGRAKTLLYDARASALFHLLAQTRTFDELSQELPSLSPEATAMLLGLLLASGAAAADGALDDTRQAALETWSFHDLLFHTRSRMGRHTEPYGATCPFRDRLEYLPAVKPRGEGSVILLHRPDIAALVERDVPFTRVLEDRRSIRAHGDKPLSIHQIGDFLYRTARVRAVYDRSDRKRYASTSRPYPGGSYELEIYLAVGLCDGLDPGLYHYDPLDHALTISSGPSRAVNALLEDARLSMGNQGASPQTLVVLAARFQRVTWKYESMAYALILKDVGVLYQTMYLVATAMGLAPCALGIGNSDAFAEAAGLDYYAETSVGEFVLGSLPAPTQIAPADPSD